MAHHVPWIGDCVVFVDFWKPPYCGFPQNNLKNTCNCDSFRIFREAKRSSVREVTEATEVPHAIEDQFQDLGFFSPL